MVCGGMESRGWNGGKGWLSAQPASLLQRLPTPRTVLKDPLSSPLDRGGPDYRSGRCASFRPSGSGGSRRVHASLGSKRSYGEPSVDGPTGGAQRRENDGRISQSSDTKRNWAAPVGEGLPLRVRGDPLPCPWLPMTSSLHPASHSIPFPSAEPRCSGPDPSLPSRTRTLNLRAPAVRLQQPRHGKR